jgi:hypothetical protein
MIRKSGNRFSEKIMLHQKDRALNRFNLKPSRSKFLGKMTWQDLLAISFGSFGNISWQVLSASSLGKIS